MKGKQVGVQINTTAQVDLEKREGVKVAKYNTIDLALLDLQNKRIDAVVIDAPVAKYMIFQSFHDLKTVGRRFTDEKFGIALAQGSDDLLLEINKALKKIKETGEYDRIHEKWFGEAAERAAQSQLPAAAEFAGQPAQRVGLERVRQHPCFRLTAFRTFERALLKSLRSVGDGSRLHTPLAFRTTRTLDRQ